MKLIIKIFGARKATKYNLNWPYKIKIKNKLKITILQFVYNKIPDCPIQ